MLHAGRHGRTCTHDCSPLFVVVVAPDTGTGCGAGKLVNMWLLGRKKLGAPPEPARPVFRTSP
ncbi:hypothetical protein AWT69_002899 [Pseudomonas putida]|nr:hypothetical protein AWT69_002899 [Pseudomonas putida]